MSEQVKLLRTYNQWRRSEIEGSMDELGLHPTDIGKAIDSVLDDYATLQAECERLSVELDKAWRRAETAEQNARIAAQELAALKEQFGELHKARNLLSKLSSAGFDVGGDAAESILAMRAELAAIKAQEPVAFRYKPRDGGMWSYVDWREPDDFEQDQCVIEYLYTLSTINQQLTVK